MVRTRGAKAGGRATRSQLQKRKRSGSSTYHEYVGLLKDAPPISTVMTGEMRAKRVVAPQMEREDDQDTLGHDNTNDSLQAGSEDYLLDLEDEAEQIRSEDRGEINTHEGISSSGLKRKGKRGSVCCRKIIDLEPGEKLEIEFNGDCQPIGENIQEYKYFLGQTARNRTACSLQVETWGDISIQQKEFIWEIIREKFSFDLQEMRKEYILKHVGNFYRDYRHKLKAHYFDYDKKNKRPLNTLMERRNNKPEKLQQCDWDYLCQWWSSPKFQRKSVKAKENRAQQKMPHYSGSKSYAQIKEEFKIEHKKDPTRVDVLIEARKRKKEGNVAAETLANNKNAVDKMINLRKQRENGENCMSDDQIMEEAIGADKNGYLRGYGPGKSVTAYFGVKPSRLQLARQVANLEKNAEERVEEARKDVEKAKEEFDSKLAEKLAANNQMWQEKLEANNKMWEERWSKMREELGLS